MTNELKLILNFLEIANSHLPNGYRNYFHYSNISVTEFFTIANQFSESELSHAIECIRNNEWDQSELIMQTEKECI